MGAAEFHSIIRRFYSIGKGNLTKTDNFIDGLIGRSAPSDVYNCYAHGIVTATHDNWEVGGLIGKLYGYVTNSYAIVGVNCNVEEYENNIGGLIGNIMGTINDYFSLKNNYYDILGYYNGWTHSE